MDHLSCFEITFVWVRVEFIKSPRRTFQSFSLNLGLFSFHAGVAKKKWKFQPQNVAVGKIFKKHLSKPTNTCVLCHLKDHLRFSSHSRTDFFASEANLKRIEKFYWYFEKNKTNLWKKIKNKRIWKQFWSKFEMNLKRIWRKF